MGCLSVSADIPLMRFHHEYLGIISAHENEQLEKS